MKDKRNKRIKILAQKIAKAESDMRLGKNVKQNQQKIKDIMSNLSVEDMIAIDDYIHSKNI